MPLASSQPPSARGALAVTVDLEEYFQVQVMVGVVRPDDWGNLPSRVEAQTEALLELFAAADAAGTFFVVGWVAERYPRLIARVAAAGHEIACHSYWHRPVFELTPAEFREDTRRAKAVIENAIGAAVAGYRAPNFSIHPEMDWAWDVLADAGFAYDSSLHPVRHPLYGAAHAPRRPFRLPRHGMWELPLATAELLGQRLPVAGGAYWRFAPLVYSRWGLGRAASDLGRAIAYLHPWELDPGQPRLPLRLSQRLRHYTGTAGLARKLRRLLAAFGSLPLRTLYAPELSRAEVPA